MTTNYPTGEPQYPGEQWQPSYPAPAAYDYPYVPYGGYYPPPAPPPPPARRARRGLIGAGIATLAAAAVVGGIAVADNGAPTVTGSGSAVAQAPTTPGGNGGNGGNGSGDNGAGTLPGNFPNGGSLPNSTGNGTTSVGLATAAQSKGIVTIVSVLQYQNAESAGTGMVLTSNGEILTNNHVINGATSVTVTVVSTGKSYRADVVGTDPSDDVAVLQLRNASGLATANIGDSSAVKTGTPVVGVGNAGGTGTLRASAGSVTALNRSITATDETGQGGERLTGLIQVNAPIISGDSGGPLYDAAGDIVGMDTAASASPASSAAFAIPIDTAVKIAGEIESGVRTTSIHIGLPAFLGVGVADDQANGATVGEPLDGGPAAAAGITSGSVITAVGGTHVSSAASLKKVLGSYRPGQTAKITWTAPSGASHTATVTLASGPAD